MCGEGRCAVPAAARPPGRSPRVRGRRAHGSFAWRSVGSIPACAGKAVSGIGGKKESEVDPRVCGEGR